MKEYIFIMNQELYISLLKEEIAPALGCTEPIAIAYASAKAREALGENPSRIFVQVSRNILKNAMGVGIPGTDMVGLEIASALGGSGRRSGCLPGSSPFHHGENCGRC